ncbi:MAG: chaperone modulator CbpM [Nitrospirales bacterium]
MNDDHDHSDEPVTAEFFTEGWIRREEICTRLGIGEDLLEVCLQWTIIETREPDPEGTILFSLEDVDRLSQGLRLHRDLGINWPGVSVALSLLDRIRELEQQQEQR